MPTGQELPRNYLPSLRYVPLLFQTTIPLIRYVRASKLTPGPTNVTLPLEESTTTVLLRSPAKGDRSTAIAGPVTENTIRAAMVEAGDTSRDTFSSVDTKNNLWERLSQDERPRAREER